MKCPKCNGPSKVMETRPNKRGYRKRRECLTCMARFTTQEIPIEEVSKMQSKNMKEELRFLIRGELEMMLDRVMGRLNRDEKDSIKEVEHNAIQVRDAGIAKRARANCG